MATPSRAHYRTWSRNLLIVVVFASLRCASLSPTKHQLAQQFITDQPPSHVFRRITEDLSLDQAVLESMRKEAELGGETVLAVVELQRGIHPHSVFVFVRNQSGIGLRETAIYWGRIQMKRHTTVSEAEFTSLDELASRAFKCGGRYCFRCRVHHVVVRFASHMRRRVDVGADDADHRPTRSPQCIRGPDIRGAFETVTPAGVGDACGAPALAIHRLPLRYDDDTPRPSESVSADRS